MNKRISFAEKYQMCKWLEGKAEEIREGRWNYVELAKAVSKHLGFPISDDCVRHSLQRLGISRVKPNTPGTPLQNLEARLARIERELGLTTTTNE